MTQPKKETEEEAFARWQNEVAEIYDIAASGEKIVRTAGFLTVNAVVADKIASAVNVDVTGYLHTVDTDSFRHILKKHGKPSEALRGQVPLVKADFLNLLDVITEPDGVEAAGTTRQGLIVVLLTKEVIGHNLFYKVGLRLGRKRICPVTFYKRRVR